MCESCDLLRQSLAHAERDVTVWRSQCKAARKDAEQAWKVARAPDATLRLIAAEAPDAIDALKQANDALRKEMAALRQFVGDV